MAIKVSGTTVIDDSRQLTNIASVDATTVAALGTSGVGGGLLKELYTTTFSNVASVTVTPTNIGSTTYEEYEVHGYMRLNAANYFHLQSRVYTGTTLHTNSTYDTTGNHRNYGYISTSSSFFIHSHNSNQCYSDATTLFPFRIVYTKAGSYQVMMYSWMSHINGSSQGGVSISGGDFTSAGSGNITGFQYFPSTGTMTGELWVYGVDR